MCKNTFVSRVSPTKKPEAPFLRLHLTCLSQGGESRASAKTSFHVSHHLWCVTGLTKAGLSRTHSYSYGGHVTSYYSSKLASNIVECSNPDRFQYRTLLSREVCPPLSFAVKLFKCPFLCRVEIRHHPLCESRGGIMQISLSREEITPFFLCES